MTPGRAGLWVRLVPHGLAAGANLGIGLWALPSAVGPVFLAVCAAQVWLLVDAVRAAAAERGPTGRCAACGYDLRATPRRCPECGTVPRGSDSPV